MKNKSFLCLLLAFASYAEVLVQGSFSLQVNDSVARLSGYKVSYSEAAKSPYDLSIGYLFSFSDVVVVPVMLEGKATTLESYLNTGDMKASEIAPLEVLLKPGLKLTGSDVYVILGYQLGNFNQKVETGSHSFELKVNPTFYGAGYTKSLSDYLDYLVETKVYYQSAHSYGFNFSDMTIDPNLVVSDAKLRFGIRLKV